MLNCFVVLPSPRPTNIIYSLEDVIRFNLPKYFSHDQYSSYIFKVTRDRNRY
jgi:hypothetical protein